jgi:hypothetical protein
MKRINCILLIFAGCFLIFSSCKKSGANPPIPQTLATSISLEYGGRLFLSPNAVAVFYKPQDALQITAQFDNITSITIVITNVGTGTFDLSRGNIVLSFADGLNGPDSFVSVSGSLAITQFSSTSIVGSFQFSGTDSMNVTRQITNGQFVTSYSTVL